MSYLKTKPGSLEEAIRRNDEDYQAMFKKELEKTGKSIPQMTPDEKKKFFNKIDKMHAAKNEAKVDELTKAQKKLPPALQKAIKKKEMKEEQISEMKKVEIKLHPQDIDKTVQKIQKHIDIINRGRGSKIDVIQNMSDDSVTLDGRGADVDREVRDIRNFIGYKSARVIESVSEAKDTEKVAQLKTKLGKEKDTDKLEAQIVDLKGQLALAKQQLENEKNKAVKPEPNPETGEVPLTVGVAYKHLRDKMKKESEKKKTMVGTKANKVDTKPEVEFNK